MSQERPPIRLCASAHKRLEDGLGNPGHVVFMAIDRLLELAPSPETKGLVEIIHQHHMRVENLLRKGIFPCEVCTKCGDGICDGE